MIRVLIAEDDPMVAELNRGYIESIAGFETAGIAFSAEEALQKVESEKPDLLLLDIYMPGMTGLGVIEALRTAGFQTDVIMISAANDLPSIQKAMQFGAVDYLIKPFQFDRFQKALLAYAEKRQFFQEKTDVKQSELDAMLFQKKVAEPPHDLPKGLTKQTLATVWSAVEKSGQADFSAEDVAFSSGMSRVSVRKYLAFLQEAGVLQSDIFYGSVGRPQIRYRINELMKERIQLYI